MPTASTRSAATAVVAMSGILTEARCGEANQQNVRGGHSHTRSDSCLGTRKMQKKRDTEIRAGSQLAHLIGEPSGAGDTWGELSLALWSATGVGLGFI